MEFLGYNVNVGSDCHPERNEVEWKDLGPEFENLSVGQILRWRQKLCLSSSEGMTKNKSVYSD
jgi:hypothetical protein